MAVGTQQVDLILAHSGTYFTSAALLPVHQVCKAPVVMLNLQPAPQMNYARTGTGEWLAADLATGEIFGPFALAEETRTVHPVTVADGWLYFSTGSLSGGGASVCRYRLADGACETLTQSVAYSFDLGHVKDGYLYFSYTDYSGSLNRIPAAGGHVEPLAGTLESVGLKQAVWLGGEDGSIYLAAIRSVSEAERRLILYALDTETLTLTEIGSVPAKDSTIRAGRLQNGIFTAVFHSDPPLCILLNR